MSPTLTDHHLAQLAHRPGPWVTIGMPVHGGGPLAKGDPILYRNLVRKISDLLAARETGRELGEALLGPLEALGAQHGVFNAGARGLVVFVSPEGAEHWHLPFEIEEFARVDERPFLEPLIPLVTDPAHFYIVALSQHAVRLLECNRYVARELPLPEGTPTRIEDAAGWEVEQDTLQAHDIHPAPVQRWAGPRKVRAPAAAVGRQPIFHGHGAGKDDVETDLSRFVRELDPALWKAITHHRSPVVLAASEALQPIFREHTRLPNVVDSYVHGGVEHMKDAELHARALELVAPLFERELEEAKARFAELSGTGRAITRIEEVVPAAADGKIDTLFVRRGAEISGAFNPATHAVVLGGKESATTDLLHLATTDTFLSGGTIHRLEPDHMPVDAEVAAILRY